MFLHATERRDKNVRLKGDCMQTFPTFINPFLCTFLILYSIKVERIYLNINDFHKICFNKRFPIIGDQLFIPVINITECNCMLKKKNQKLRGKC